MKFEIKHRFSGSVLFSLETDSLKLCVEAAVKSGAYLDGANLDGANLGGANLGGAYLDGANLDGANLRGERPIFIVGPIGSRADHLTSYITDKGIMIKTGCFYGSLDQFREAIEHTHGDNNHAAEYFAAISLIETHAQLYPADKSNNLTTHAEPNSGMAREAAIS